MPFQPLNVLFQEISLQRAEQLTPQIVEQRKFKNSLLGYGSPCRYCACETDLIRWNFALMRVEGSRISIGTTVTSAAVSAITLPFLGAGLLRLPGRSHSGQALHLRLITCKPCCKRHGNFFGLFTLNERRASTHPLWHALHEHGFTKYLAEEKMPDEFKYNVNQDL